MTNQRSSRHQGHSTRPDPTEEAPDHVYTKPSKSQQKRDMTALQKLGEELVEQSAERLDRVDMPEGLRTAIDDARRIHDHEGRRRQMQYIGRLMRDVDPAPIRAALDAWAGASRAETNLLHELERWRERLLEDEEALAGFATEYPAALNPATLQRLRAAVRATKKERADNRPPKNYRELFRLVRAVVVGDDATNAGDVNDAADDDDAGHGY
jgi:ribosome-associated protein